MYLLDEGDALIDEAWRLVGEKKNDVDIDPKLQFYGKLAELLTEDYRQRILALFKCSRVGIDPATGESFSVQRLPFVREKSFIEGQDAGNPDAKKEADTKVINTKIEEDDMISEDEKQPTRLRIEIKSKSCWVYGSINNPLETYWNEYVKFGPKIIYPMNYKDYYALTQEMKKGDTFILTWGLYVLNPKKDKPVVTKAYCYLFSGDEILKMLQPLAGEKLLTNKDKGNAFMNFQETDIWSKQKISEVISVLKERGKEDPVYRLYCEYKKSQRAHLLKTCIRVDEITPQSTRIEELKNARKSLHSDEYFINEGRKVYPLRELPELLRGV